MSPSGHAFSFPAAISGCTICASPAVPSVLPAFPTSLCRPERVPELPQRSRASQAGLDQPQSVLEMLKEHTGLVVLGDPGAGKTTLVKYLALRLAHGEGPEMGLGHRLPVALSLATYAAELEQDDVRLDDFIADSFQRRIADLPLKQMLTESLQRGTALVLLDGLDEVRDLSMRSTVVERVVDFYAYHAQAGNKFIITSRIVGYHSVRPSAAGLGRVHAGRL